MTFGEKIAALRKSKNMTQEELGKVLNVTYQAVSKWERGASLPDLATISLIAKYFQVPLSYFEDGGEQEIAAAHTETEMSNILGMCTECGKMIKEDEAFATSPKIICKNCHERKEQENIKKAEQIKESEKRSAQHYADLQRGSGFDVKLIVSLVLTLACYIGLTVLCFIKRNDDVFFYSIFLFIVPIIVFACTHAVFDFISDLRDKDEDDYDGYKLSLSLITAAGFAIVNMVLFLIIYFTLDNGFYILILLFVGMIASFTFVSQFMLGNVIKDLFTAGGFTFKLPGFIFSLTPESILLMIVTKVILGFIAIIVFIVTTVFMAVVAILGSFITFIPAVLFKAVKDKKAKNEVKKLS